MKELLELKKELKLTHTLISTDKEDLEDESYGFVRVSIWDYKDPTLESVMEIAVDHLKQLGILEHLSLIRIKRRVI
jgi:hypothetical protein